MTHSNPGEWAALTTALCWTITAVSFEKASKRIGSLPVNWIRLALAFLFFVIYSWIVRGTPLPLHASTHAWLWLTVSGLVGFVIGDMLLFRAFVEIGSRVSMLIMASVPVLTALIGYLFMNEHLSGKDIFAMVLTITGICLVVTDQNKENKKLTMRHPVRGVLLAFGGAWGQAVGLALSKYGMGQYDAFSATQIRVIAGLTGFSILFFSSRRWSHIRAGFKNPKGIALTTIGAFFGPFLGVSFSLLAIQQTLIGIASTIMSIVPILLIPPAIIFFHEKITFQEIIGAFVAVGGVALLFL